MSASWQLRGGVSISEGGSAFDPRKSWRINVNCSVCSILFLVAAVDVCEGLVKHPKSKSNIMGTANKQGI
jgi:hypothetical protein